LFILAPYAAQNPAEPQSIRPARHPRSVRYRTDRHGLRTM